MLRQKLRGFTLVELLVVITIIGILASLITVAVVGAIKHARLAAVKAEMDEIDAGFQVLKSKYAEYPPNCELSGDFNRRFTNFKRYLLQIAPRHREPEKLLARIMGGVDTSDPYFPKALIRGMSPSEAIVFWLGGFSDDPNYPISGHGGPSYVIPEYGDSQNRTLDPIESRKWILPFDVTRLGPRADDGYFDDPRLMSDQRHVEYFLNGKWRRINFWHYRPRNSEQPYLYFDVSRGSPTLDTDVGSSSSPEIYPIKQVHERDARGAPLSFKFVNQGKFQLLHSGFDGAWGDPITHLAIYGLLPQTKYPGPESQNYLRLDIDADGKISPEERQGMIVYPDGPWLDDLPDTIVNFTTGTIADPLR
jgi:prepilin-type N-terminal cleavage/methylation domain-containing protein